MRIISGTSRGLRLQSLDGPDTRPTLDNVKEAVFSMLFERCFDANVLDLFAGSGAMGIEAISRGAEFASFVDSNPKACSVIKANLEKAKMTDRSKVHCIDFKSFLKSAGGDKCQYDLIFLDPPYALGFLDEALGLILEYGLVRKNGLIVCEFDSGTTVNTQGYKLLKDKRYGRVCVNILEALS